jgi:hypothetical protein
MSEVAEDNEALERRQWSNLAAAVVVVVVLCLLGIVARHRTRGSSTPLAEAARMSRDAD